MVAAATMTPLNVEAPPKKLLELVAKVIVYSLSFSLLLPLFEILFFLFFIVWL